MKFAILFSAAALATSVVAQFPGVGLPPMETYTPCTEDQALAINCGYGGNCVIVNSLPGCTCLVDIQTGLPLTGNPYEGCTYDMSGIWQLFSYQDRITGFSKTIMSPVSNEPFIIRIDRTDALLKTHYIFASVFLVTALTAFAVGICNKVLLDIRDNRSCIIESAEGYTGNKGRGMVLRTPRQDTSLIKEGGLNLFSGMDLTGDWVKEDGSQVNIRPARNPRDISAFWSGVQSMWNAYSYDDPSFGSELVRDTMGIWLDKEPGLFGGWGRDDEVATAPMGIDPTARFVQTGFFGELRFGSRRIDIFKTSDGRPILTLFQLDPQSLPQFAPFASSPALFSGQGVDGSFAAAFSTEQQQQASTTNAITEIIYNQNAGADPTGVCAARFCNYNEKVNDGTSSGSSSSTNTQGTATAQSVGTGPAAPTAPPTAAPVPEESTVAAYENSPEEEEEQGSVKVGGSGDGGWGFGR